MNKQIMNSREVIVVGELNADLILDQLEGKYPEVGKEILAGSMTLTLGSSSAIFASNLSSLGARVRFTGIVGKDLFADLVLNNLQEKGVETSDVIRSDTFRTGVTVALSYGNDRAMVTHPGAMDHMTASMVPNALFRKGNHLHLSSVFLQKGIRPDLTGLFRRAKESGMTTSCDTQWDPEEQWDLDLENLLPLVDVFLPNREELLHLTGARTVEQALSHIGRFANSVAVKLGEEGAMLWSATRGTIRQPVFRNPRVIDTIGAGDSFDAGFIWGFIRNAPPEECLRLGTLAGAINTTGAGGTTAFQGPEEIREIARGVFNAELP
jgi:sugar/nucleoside kinase (ribokinase family)